MPQSPQSGDRPVTIRDIADYLGVSNATVSLALRGNPRISAKTREKVERAAAELGYRPDPQLAKLMFRLRSQRVPGFQSTVAALTTVREEEDLPYIRQIRQAAKVRAELLGYAFLLMRVPNQEKQKPSVQRMLRSRGVEGLLILPMASPINITRWLDWKQFAAVATTYAVVGPDLHRVVPHQFGNTLQICKELADLGYRRIGLVLSGSADLAVNHGFSGAVAWQSMLGGTELVRPLIYAGESPVGVERWFRDERPEVIIASGEEACRSIARRLKLTIPGPIGFAVTDWAGETEFAGIEERPSEIGETAVDLLHTKIISGSYGVPKVPAVAMISGRWISGPSVETRIRQKRVKTQK